MSPSLPQLPKLPAVDDTLPELPALPAVGQDAAEQAKTLEDRAGEWGRGSRAAFVIWSFLKSKGLQEGVDFQYDGEQFFIGGTLLWRLESGQGSERGKAAIDKMMYERRGVRVEDFEPTAIVPGHSEGMLGASLSRR